MGQEGLEGVDKDGRFSILTHARLNLTTQAMMDFAHAKRLTPVFLRKTGA
jgi:hypothetical protein